MSCERRVRGVGDVDPLGGADPRHCLWHTGALLVSAPPPAATASHTASTGHRTGHAARSGGERVCGLAPVRATRPARGGATGSGCTEPNHGARWGVRAGRLVRRFAGYSRGCIGRKKVCARVFKARPSRLCRGADLATSHGHAPGPRSRGVRRTRAVRRVHAQDPLLFSSLSGREEPNEQRCTIPGDVPNDPPGSPWSTPWRRRVAKSTKPPRPAPAREWGLCLGHPGPRCRIPEPRGL
jgi:hypothetical protein